jgi:hypothetical protein
MNGRRRVFTPQNLALIKRMAEEGCSSPEIANTIGSTPSSVRVNCSHHGIRIRRGRGCAAWPLPAHEPSASDLEVPVVAHLPATLYAEFCSRANDMHQPVSIFASMLLKAIATSNLYKAVLDE